MCCRCVHRIINIFRTYIQCTAEDSWECQYVIDLIREVTASGTDYGCSCLHCQIRHDFRNRICHREQDRIFCHGLYHFFRYGSRCGYSDKYICTFQYVSEASCLFFSVGDRCHLCFFFIQTFSAFIDGTLAVAHDNILQSKLDQQFDDRTSGCSCTGHNYFDIFDFSSGKLQCIQQCCCCYNGRSMLVVMKYRNVAAFF